MFVVGHFGTYGGLISDQLCETLPLVLRAGRNRQALLLGRGGDQFASHLSQKHPELRGRIVATGALTPERLASHLAACDCLIQPFPDGVTTRRTSLMAGLALGKPIATTVGHLTEALWSESQVVSLTPVSDPTGLAAAVEELLNNEELRRELGMRAARLYEEEFALEHTIRELKK
jgi:glycosyltransferase involved in cell wall biosynthesis